VNARIFGILTLLLGVALLLGGLGFFFFGLSAAQFVVWSGNPAPSIAQVQRTAAPLTTFGIWLMIPGAALTLIGYLFSFTVFGRSVAAEVTETTTAQKPQKGA
jgi:hypothetical protein